MNLKVTRKKLDLTQAELGGLMKISPQRISGLEHGTEGRKLTKIQTAFVKVLLFVKEHGLLQKLTKRSKKWK